MEHINRYSHVVMDGSPVPFGRSKAKFSALSLFAMALKDVVNVSLQPGRALRLLPPAERPEDMSWAAGNPRIAEAMSRWAAAIDHHARPAVPVAVQTLVESRLRAWQGEAMPVSRSWLEECVTELEEPERAIARLCLVIAQSPWQLSEELITELADGGNDKVRLVKILNYAAFTGARRIGERLGHHYLNKPLVRGAA